MIDSKFHIELDGVAYRLAESAQGQHHNVRGEPLRPPNAVTVQGENQQKFQPRPDLLLWTWTDWSQGEGLRTLKFGPQFSGRSWQLNGVRVFEEPGHLIPGYYVEETQDSLGAFADDVTLVNGIGGTLYALERDTANVYTWDPGTELWDAGAAITGPSTGADDAVGDDDAIYWTENGVATVWKWTGSGAATSLSTTLIGTSGRHISQLADYIYVYRPKGATVWEIPKTGGSITAIDSWTETGLNMGDGARLLAALNGRIYAMITQSNQTMIREITPTSAAGTGFGAEIARIRGFVGENLYAHSGALFMVGRYRDSADAEERTVLYLPPGDSYGSLGQIRQGDQMGLSAGGDGRMLDHFFLTRRRSSSDLGHTLWQVDSVSGGFAVLAWDETNTVGAFNPQAPVTHEGQIYWATVEGATTHRVLRARPDQYMSDCNAISPEHNFDLVGEKFLSSLTLNTEPLPANWTVDVDYMLDNDGTWTNGISFSGDNGTGVNTAITTDTSTVEFRTLKLRIRFQYTGGGVPTTAPVVLGVEARAVVAEKVKVFQFLLDLSSDQSAGKKSQDGPSKVDSFLATAAKKTVLDLKDGYTSPRAGEYDQYDVFLDEFNVVLDRPGEGMAAVTLKEVI